MTHWLWFVAAGIEIDSSKVFIMKKLLISRTNTVGERLERWTRVLLYTLSIAADGMLSRFFGQSFMGENGTMAGSMSRICRTMGFIR